MRRPRRYLVRDACSCLLLQLQPSCAYRAVADLDSAASGDSSQATRVGADFPLAGGPYRSLRRLAPASGPAADTRNPSLVEVVPADDDTRGTVVNFGVSSERLGTGTFGDTWLATDTRTQTKVAVKFFYHGKPDDVQYYFNQADYGQPYLPGEKVQEAVDECIFANRVIASAEKSCLVGSANIAACLEEHARVSLFPDYDTSPLYIVMEHGGENVADWLWKRQGKHNIWKARMVVKQILQGLVAMAKMNKIHHDLKPGNVVMSEDTGKTDSVGNALSRVKLIDFGAVMDADPQCQARDPNCPQKPTTLLYAPPEYFDGYNYLLPVHAYDVWAAGLIYLELACPTMPMMEGFTGGKRLFNGETVNDIFKRYGCLSTSPGDNKASEYDINTIRHMLQELPTERQSPETILGYQHMLQASFDGKELEVGQDVEYCIDGRGWVETRVTRAVGNGIYQLKALPSNAYVDKSSLKLGDPKWIKDYLSGLRGRVQRVGLETAWNVGTTAQAQPPQAQEYMTFDWWKYFCQRFYASYPHQLSDYHFLKLFKAVSGGSDGMLTLEDFRKRLQ